MEQDLENRDPQSRLIRSKTPQQPRFDPHTGEPLTKNAGLKRSQNLSENGWKQPSLKYSETTVVRSVFEEGDPYRKEETQKASDYYEPEEPSAEVPRFDPETGAPLFRNGRTNETQYGQQTEKEPELLDEFRRPDKKKKEGNRLFMILMIILTAIMVAGIGIVLFFLLKSSCGSGNDPEAEETSSETFAPDSGIKSEIVDTWTVTKFKNDGTLYQASETGYKGSFDIRNDGTIEISLNGYETKVPYTFSKNTVSFVMDGKTVNGTYNKAEDQLYIHFEDQKFSIWLQRESTVPISTVTPVPQEEKTQEPVVETTPEPPSPTQSFEPLGNSFVFGGVSIDRGTTEINGDTLRINGTANNIKCLTRKEVETLVKMCPNLSVLKLQYCYMETYEPLSELTGLVTLELRFCYYGEKGKPITNIEWVKPLKNLRRLSLNHNRITDASPLEGLNSLRVLNLGENLLNDESIKTIATLENITDLNLYSNPITDLEPLKDLENIVYLNFHHTNVKSIDFLTDMQSLKRIFIGCDYDNQKLPEFDWFNVLKSCKNLKDVTVKGMEKEIISILNSLHKKGYINDPVINDA
jgi:hypothetical protein